MAHPLQSERTVDRSSNGREIDNGPGVGYEERGHWGVSNARIRKVLLARSPGDPGEGGALVDTAHHPRGPFKRSKWTDPAGDQPSHDTCFVVGFHDEEVNPSRSEASIRIVRHTRRADLDGVHRSRRWHSTCRHDRTYPPSDTCERCDDAAPMNRGHVDEDRVGEEAGDLIPRTGSRGPWVF